MNRNYVLAGLLIGNFLAAVDVNIVSTSMPTIVGELGGLHLMPWVFTAFLLTSTITIPIYGKLADLYGRKSTFIGATLFLLLGSVLCAFAGTMLELVICRAIQGLGGAGIIAIGSTIVADIYRTEERGMIQGWISTVWGVSSVFGPILGAVLPQWLGWRSVFTINIPFCLIVLLFIWRSLHERVERKKHKIDYAGMLTLSVSTTLLMFVLLNGGTVLAWSSWPIFWMSAGAVLMFLVFLAVERRAVNPVIPFDLYRSRVVVLSSIGSFLVGGINLCIYSYIPSYSQGVLGTTPTLAGFTLTSMSISWVLSQFVLGKLIVKWGSKRLAILGFSVILIASIILVSSDVRYGLGSLMVAMFLMGFGLGLSQLTFTLVVQSSVSWDRRGIATSLNQFIRSFGRLVGVAAVGSFINLQIARGLSGFGGGSDPLAETNLLFNESTRAALSPERLKQVIDTYDGSLHQAFLLFLLCSIIGLWCSFRFPSKEQKQAVVVKRQA